MTKQERLIISASHVINLFFWVKMQEHLGDFWVQDGDGSVPIIPAQEQPEETSGDSPYIVYIYNTMIPSSFYVYEEEQLYWTIYSQRSTVISSTIKLARTLFKSYDKAAQEVNDWILDDLDDYRVGDPDFDSWIDDFKNYQFKSIKFLGGMSAQPATSEGGRNEGTITISMEYVELEDAF